MDDIGYSHPSVLAKLSDDELREWVRDFEKRRYGGWRNHENLWRSTLGLDTTRDKHIIDYGCGFGIEALQFAKLGNRISLFDLTEAGLEAASRVLRVHGFDCNIVDELPEADIFYANGSLHHTPDAGAILHSAPCPEARLMVYSDRAGDSHSEVPFWRQMDEVGGYADKYSPADLDALSPDWELVRSDYITPDGSYLTATLRRR